MPYIITTTTAFNDPQLACCGRDAADCDCESPREFPVRRAVATLEEARAEIRTDLCDWHGATGPDDPAIVATLDLSEASGGTVGPLPDGTIIEVTPIEWSAVLATLGHALTFAPAYTAEERAKVLDAYNAQVTA